jgi:N-acetylneuraminate synthase/N,N'-diacetyllegionaminate synthase
VKVLAELGQTANDNHETALTLLYQCHRAGVWGVKVQLLTPDKIAHPTAVPYWYTTRYAATQAESFALAGTRPPDWFRPVRDAARRVGVKFVASVFDLEAVAAAVDLDVDAIKIASGDLTNWEILDAAAHTGKPVILSTGASTITEIADACDTHLRCAARGPLTLLACSLVYPCPDDDAAVGRIETLRSFAATCDIAHVGYSDHTLGTRGGFAAALLGADPIEKHVRPYPSDTPRDAQVPDLDMALTPAQLADYVIEASRGARWRGTPGMYPLTDEQAARYGARRSWFAARPLPAGHTIQPGDLVCLRPWKTGHVRPDHNPYKSQITAPVEPGEPLTTNNYHRP